MKAFIKIRAWLFLFCFISGIPDNIFAQYSDEFPFGPIEKLDHLKEGYFTTIAKDSMGFIWLGTQEGLLKYDGYKWTKFQHNPRVTILTQENQKLPKALSNGFDYAKGEFLTWTSSDNYYRPEAITKMVDFLKRNPDVQATYCDYVVIGDDGQPLHDSDFRTHNQDPQNTSHIHVPQDTNRLNIVKDNYIGACFMYRSWLGRTSCSWGCRSASNRW